MRIAQLALILSAGLTGLSAHAAAPAGKAGQIKRGEYLVTTSACIDCHTPLKMGPRGPEPDMSRLLSGHPEQVVLPPAPALPPGGWDVVASGTTAWHGPWGTSFTANLTPDADTGLGKWTLADFKATLRSGRHLGKGRPILPPMPVAFYSKFSDADLEAIFAYLQSVPAIKNRVPEPRPPKEAPQQVSLSH